MAVNCCELPSGTEGVAGVTAIETKAGAVTVRFVDPLTAFNVAVTFVVPCAALVASP